MPDSRKRGRPHLRQDEQATTESAAALLAWLRIGVPGKGVYNTVLNSLKLFQAAPASSHTAK
jgi:hypothetical protein